MRTERTNEIDEAASDWLIQRESGNWTESDQARFEQWLGASTLNRVAYLRLELAWEDAARLKALGAGIRSDQPPPPGQWNLTPFFDTHPPGSASTVDDEQGFDPLPILPKGQGEAVQASPEETPARGKSGIARHRWRLFAAAATLLLAVGISAYVALIPGGERYTTAVGDIESVPMTDGSKVTLNTDSQIRVALTDTERRVELKHGEAFFEVSKDPKRPFVVNVGSKRVIAVGTQFSVRRDSDGIQIIVTEGKVRVEDTSFLLHVRTQGLASDVPQDYGAADIFLTPGSIARASDAGVLVQRKTLPEAEEQLSWRTGVLMFRNQSLGDAIAEFNRYNTRKIIIADPDIAALKIEGNFRATNVDAFVRLLENGFPLRATTQEDRIVLTSK